MGYYLQAFIGKKEDVDAISQKFHSATIQNLEQGISLIMLTEELFGEMTNSTPSPIVNGFEYLTNSVETNVLRIIGDASIGYVEACYFGGEGNQSGVIWQKGERIFFTVAEQDIINKVLKYFEVITKDDYDEFDTLKFGFLESTRDWDSY
jgi:hypothetical protein